MQRPSITFINRVYPPSRGATGRMLQDLARAFSREGWRVTIVTTGKTSAKEKDGNINVIRVKANEKPRSIFSYLMILIKLTLAALNQPKEHIIVSMTDPPLLAIACNALSKWRKTRHIHWSQDIYPDLLPIIGKKLPNSLMIKAKFMMDEALHNCDRVIAIGRCMGRQFTSEGHDPRKITVIPNWADQHLLESTSPEKKAKTSPPPASHLQAYSKPHQEQRKNDKKFRILYAGTIGLAHPIGTILDCAEKLQTSQPAVEFVFVGDGEGFDRLAKERSSRQLDNIRLIPHQPVENLRSLMESGDIHLISMDEKAAGLLVPCKLYAALATGRPTIFIGPSASETAKTITEFEAGHVVQHNNANLLEQIITQYVVDSDTWFTAQNGAIKASQTYSPQNSIEAWLKRAWATIQTDL